ncbi:MAG: hypothetical protein GC159_17650 [Phycisphaera sp.]|nr:hypothetical protein [Phycisphaera sp.]
MPDNTPKPKSFPDTQWTLVLSGRVALDHLFVTYRPAIIGYLIRHRGFAPDAAEDLLHQFFADKMIEQDLLAVVDRRKGRFRTFLLRALDRYVISWKRKQNAKKRRPEQGHVQTLTGQDAPADDDSGDNFEIEWARRVVDETLKQMKADCETSQRPDIWGVFDDRILRVTLCGRNPVPYNLIIKRYKFESPAQASNALITAKRTFQRILRSVIAEYAGDQTHVEHEIADLVAILQHAAKDEYDYGLNPDDTAAEKDDSGACNEPAPQSV